MLLMLLVFITSYYKGGHQIMTFTEQIITIAAVVAGTMLTRFLPFILFPANKKTPPLVAFFR